MGVRITGITMYKESLSKKGTNFKHTVNESYKKSLDGYQFS